jgi:hypothetical protein
MDREIFFLILGILIPIVYDLAKPWIGSYWKKSSLSFRERRLYLLYLKYEDVKRMKESPHFFNLMAIRNIAYALVALGTMIFIGGAFILPRFSWIKSPVPKFPMLTGIFNDVMLVFELASFIILVSMLMTTTEYSWNAMHFDTFREETIAKIIKLGGNPEELEKIDKEIEAQKQGG